MGLVSRSSGRLAHKRTNKQLHSRACGPGCQIGGYRRCFPLHVVRFLGATRRFPFISKSPHLSESLSGQYRGNIGPLSGDNRLHLHSKLPCLLQAVRPVRTLVFGYHVRHPCLQPPPVVVRWFRHLIRTDILLDGANRVILHEFTILHLLRYVRVCQLLLLRRHGVPEPLCGIMVPFAGPILHQCIPYCLKSLIHKSKKWWWYDDT